MIKVVIKGENFKPFNIEVKELNLTERVELNIFLHKMYKNDEGVFGASIEIIKFTTNMNEDQINILSNDQIFEAAISISNIVNKKKEK